jgi:hypothetical protein
MNIQKRIWIHLVIIAATVFFSPLAQAENAPGLSRGQLLYAPVYSHIYAGNRQTPLLLTATLSIRNIDPLHAITITRADYYGTKGEILKKYLEQRVALLGPLESTHFVIPHKEKEGGAGANFVVEWTAEKLVNPPLVETIMIGGGSQPASFISRALEILPPH